MTHIAEAVGSSDKGTILLIEVSPGSKVSAFPSGYNPWRKAIGCRVRSPASRGKANREVITILAGFFATPKDRISIVSGRTSSLKRVLIEDINPDVVLAALCRSPGIHEIL
jgi:uncharacterized protein (TIGR00251 family)